jgi:hypothetical protein
LTPEDQANETNLALKPMLDALAQFRRGLLDIGIDNVTANRMCEQFFAMMLRKAMGEALP